jgi:hypothetical protein
MKTTLHNPAVIIPKPALMSLDALTGGDTAIIAAGNPAFASMHIIGPGEPALLVQYAAELLDAAANALEANHEALPANHSTVALWAAVTVALGALREPAKGAPQDQTPAPPAPPSELWTEPNDLLSISVKWRSHPKSGYYRLGMPLDRIVAVEDGDHSLLWHSDFKTPKALAESAVPAGYFSSCLAEGLVRVGAFPMDTLTIQARRKA